MASYVEIANMAGVLVGTDARVTDPNDDRPLARAIKAVWDLSRRSTLRDGQFNFAVKRDALPALAAAVPYPWANVFQLPAGTLRLLEVLNIAGRADYQLEGGKILCDVGAPLYIRRIADIEEPAEWDDQFAEAFARRIAWAIGRRIAGSAYDVGSGWELYEQAIGATKSTDARENPPLDQEESSWVLTRAGFADSWGRG